MVNVSDPVESGLIGSLARPGRNITGLCRLGPELTGKTLEILKESLPDAIRVTALANPTNPLNPAQISAVKQANVLSLQLGLNFFWPLVWRAIMSKASSGGGLC
jgi:putative ABC transport system substrate-binding protein